MNNHEAVTDEFKAQLVKEHNIKVTRRLNFHKRMDIKHVSSRKDVHHYKFVVDLDQSALTLHASSSRPPALQKALQMRQELAADQSAFSGSPEEAAPECPVQCLQLAVEAALEKQHALLADVVMERFDESAGRIRDLTEENQELKEQVAETALRLEIKDQEIQTLVQEIKLLKIENRQLKSKV